MKYISTRGGMAALEFSDILLEGLAPDGGLAVPEQLPQVSAQTLESWRGLSYADLAFEVLSLFATDIPAEDLRRLTRAANTQVFSSETSCRCARWPAACRCWACQRARRWRSRTWPCSSWARSSNTCWASVAPR